MRREGNVTWTRKKLNAYRVLVRKPEVKRPLRRPRRTWVENTKIYVRETGWSAMDWIDLAQDRDLWRTLVNKVMNLRVPENVGKFLSRWPTGSSSRSAQLHGIFSDYQFPDSCRWAKVPSNFQGQRTWQLPALSSTDLEYACPHIRSHTAHSQKLFLWVSSPIRRTGFPCHVYRISPHIRRVCSSKWP
jgi:hypothetical protein